MFRAKCKLESMTAVSFSKEIQSERDEGETHGEFDERCWRERLHVTSDGYVRIPIPMFKGAYFFAANLYEEKVAGNTKFKKFFQSGIQVIGKDIILPIKVDEVDSEKFSVPSDGVRGGNKRVPKRFPIISEWKGEIEVLVTNSVITKAAFKEVSFIAGMQVGVGRNRPGKGGNLGMFNFVEIEYINDYSDRELKEIGAEGKGHPKLLKRT